MRIGTIKPRPLFFGQELDWLTEQGVCEPFRVADLCPAAPEVWLSFDAPLTLVEVTCDVTVLFTYCEHVACRGGDSKSQETLVRDRKGRRQVGHVDQRQLGWGSSSWAAAFVACFLYQCCVLFSLVWWVGEVFPLPRPFSRTALSHVEKVPPLKS